MTQQTFDVDGLHCGGCVNTVRETILALSGVTAVNREPVWRKTGPLRPRVRTGSTRGFWRDAVGPRCFQAK